MSASLDKLEEPNHRITAPKSGWYTFRGVVWVGLGAQARVDVGVGWLAGVRWGGGRIGQGGGRPGAGRGGAGWGRAVWGGAGVGQGGAEQGRVVQGGTG